MEIKNNPFIDLKKWIPKVIPRHKYKGDIPIITIEDKPSNLPKDGRNRIIKRSG